MADSTSIARGLNLGNRKIVVPSKIAKSNKVKNNAQN